MSKARISMNLNVALGLARGASQNEYSTVESSVVVGIWQPVAETNRIDKDATQENNNIFVTGYALILAILDAPPGWVGVKIGMNISLQDGRLS